MVDISPFKYSLDVFDIFIMGLSQMISTIADEKTSSILHGLNLGDYDN